MKKIFLIFAFLLSLCSLSYAQGSLVWWNSAQITDLQETKTAIQSKSGRFWVAACSTDFKPNYNQSLSSAFAFSDSTGDTLWYKRFWDTYPVISDGWGVAHAPNNNFWVVVAYRTSIGTYPNSGIGVFLMDSLGQTLMHREYMYGCRFFNPHSVFGQPDGGMVIVGTLNDYNLTGTCTDWDLFALRIDGEGNQIWQQTYVLPKDQGIYTSGEYPGNKICLGYADVGNGTDNKVGFIDAQTGVFLYNRYTLPPAGHFQLRTWPLKDGSFILGGSTTNNASGMSYIARTDADFNIIWEKTDPTSTGYGSYFGAETKDSCIIVLGLNKTVGYGRFMAKVRLSDGQELWRWYFKQAHPNQTEPYSLVVYNLKISQDGDLFALGAFRANIYAARYTGVADFLQPSDYCSDSLRANFTGSWHGDTLQLYNASNSGMALQDSVDCQWLIGGSTVSIDTAINMQISPAAHPNGLPVTLIITNFWGCKDTLTAIVTPQGIVGNKPVQKGVFVGEPYPNPATHSINLNYGLPATCKAAVARLSEVGTGKMLIEQEISLTDNTLRLNTAPLAAGMYVLQFYADGAPLGVRKVSVVR